MRQDATSPFLYTLIFVRSELLMRGENESCRFQDVQSVRAVTNIHRNGPLIPPAARCPGIFRKGQLPGKSQHLHIAILYFPQRHISVMHFTSQNVEVYLPLRKKLGQHPRCTQRQMMTKTTELARVTLVAPINTKHKMTSRTLAISAICTVVCC